MPLQTRYLETGRRPKQQGKQETEGFNNDILLDISTHELVPGVSMSKMGGSQCSDDPRRPSRTVFLVV